MVIPTSFFSIHRVCIKSQYNTRANIKNIISGSSIELSDLYKITNCCNLCYWDISLLALFYVPTSY